MGHATLPALWLGVVFLVCHKGQAVTRGKLIGGLLDSSNGVAGELYGKDNSTLLLINFFYDGSQPGTQFYVGDRRYVGGRPSVGGTVIPYEPDRDNRLRAYNNENMELILPGIQLTDILWFSVWCGECQPGRDLGSVLLPRGFSVPARKRLGSFSDSLTVTSGDVYLLDTKTILIFTLTYNGYTDGLRFIVGTYPIGSSDFRIVQSEPGNRRYVQETLELVLPDNLKAWDIDYLSLYSLYDRISHGHVSITDGTNVPDYLNVDLGPVRPPPTATPSITTTTTTTIPPPPPLTTNCQTLLRNRFEVAWRTDQYFVYLTMRGVLDTNEYMAFGLSGSDVSTVMVNGDVIVAWYADNAPVVMDYRLQARTPCYGGGFGVCADSSTVDDSTPEPPNSGLASVSGASIDGVTTIEIKRPFNTGDQLRDRVFNPFADLYYIWAIGQYNSDNSIRKHDMRVSPSNPVVLQLGRAPRSDCQGLGAPLPPTTRPPTPNVWREQRIFGSREFHVRLGPSGGRKGYEAITGQEAVDVVYYVNGLLIPVLEVERGQTYAFTLSTGNDAANPAAYFPFYITTDSQGGYGRQASQQRQQHSSYLGIEANGLPSSGSVGRFCAYLAQSPGEAEHAATFEEFFSGLSLLCHGGVPGEIEWTVPLDAPDVLYYQSYSHFRRGWKVQITGDRGPPDTTFSSRPSTFPPRPVTPTITGVPPTVEGVGPTPRPTRRRRPSTVIRQVLNPTAETAPATGTAPARPAGTGGLTALGFTLGLLLAF